MPDAWSLSGITPAIILLMATVILGSAIAGWQICAAVKRASLSSAQSSQALIPYGIGLGAMSAFGVFGSPMLGVFAIPLLASIMLIYLPTILYLAARARTKDDA